LIAERQQIVHKVCIIRYCQQIAVRNMTKLARHAMPADWWQKLSKVVHNLTADWKQIENRTWFEQTLLGFCHQSAGIACQQTLSTNPQPNADTDSYGFVIKIW